jgi:hypothetical protein
MNDQRMEQTTASLTSKRRLTISPTTATTQNETPIQALRDNQEPRISEQSKELIFCALGMVKSFSLMVLDINDLFYL